MKNKNLFNKLAAFAVSLFMVSAIAVSIAAAQTPMTAPRQEKLLNGLKVLLWSDNSADKVYVKIRIHSGSAFDPQGKEGVMQMLAGNIFPSEASREFFADDLGGSLEIIANYDYIQINASSKPESFLTMLETLSSAIANTTIDKDTTAKLRTGLITRLKDLESDPAYVADQAVASRLLGTFPYGRPQFGTQESLAKIFFPDMIDAKLRFLTADNATIAISGNYDKSYGFKVVRRLFGAWLKSDKKVPPTFRQPDAPPAGLLTVASPKPEIAALRFAMRGTARNDSDFAASRVFSSIVESRLRSRVPAAHAADVFIRNDAHVLPGIITIGMSMNKGETGAGKIEAGDLIAKALAEPVSEAEFQTARNAVAAEWKNRSVESFWLDIDTFKTTSAEADRQIFDNLTLSDIRTYGARAKAMAMVSVLVNAPVAAK